MTDSLLLNYDILLMLFLYNSVLFACAVKFNDKVKFFLGFKVHNNLQNIHHGSVPRYGGLIIYISVILSLLYFNFDAHIRNIIYFSLPIVVTALLDDLFVEIHPRYRAKIIFFSCSFFVYSLGFTLPHILIPYINYIIDSQFVLFILFTLLITSIINGMNFIDGTNGNAALNFLFIIIALLIVANQINQYQFNLICTTLAVITLSFLLFNFPMGKIFLGDCGAYFFGFISTSLLIYFYAVNSHLSPYGLLLILFYPANEFFFSLSRKILLQKNPLFPDELHIHLMLNSFFNIFLNNAQSNNLTTLTLAPLSIAGPLLFICFFDDMTAILYTLYFLLFFYLLFYYITYKLLHLPRS